MPKNITAFDIGESQVKVVSLAGGTVKRAEVFELPDNVVAGGTVVSMDALADFLKESLKTGKLSKANAAVILPDRLVFRRNVTVPPMTEGQLAYNLPFEFKDYLNQEKGRYYFDYAVQGVTKNEQGEPEELQLFACATLKSTVEDYRNMFHRAGFKLKEAIPEECAFGNLAKAHAEKNAGSDGDLCIVDLGHKGIRMYIYRDGHFRTRRAVDLGLWDLEQQLASERGVDPHMAHTHLLSDYQQAQSADASQDLYNRMAVEIMKAVNFYNYNNREQTLRGVYLCGGGAAVEPLKQTVSRVTGLELLDIAELLPDGEKIENPWLFAKAVGCGL